jgi:hypothetical protein
MNSHGVHPHIYPAILTRNDTHDRPDREWSRDVWRTTIPLPTPESKVVVVFTDLSVMPSSNSIYINNIICTNLAKNNIVIEVSRNLLENNVVHLITATAAAASANHLVKYHYNVSTPLFFPRVDECYYIPHSSHTTYETMCEVSCVIDLWNTHKEMTLHVIKQTMSNVIDNDVVDTESGTEGFDSEDADPGINSGTRFDYAKVIEEYYHTKYNHTSTSRRLVIMF